MCALELDPRVAGDFAEADRFGLADHSRKVIFEYASMFVLTDCVDLLSTRVFSLTNYRSISPSRPTRSARRAMCRCRSELWALMVRSSMRRET